MTSLDREQIEKILTVGSAIRLTVKLFPASDGDKLFPPTYEGGKYAKERRIMADGSIMDTVLLDSVQSQANRMENALLDAIRLGAVKLPLMKVDFQGVNGLDAISTLETPHRIADAIFRESIIGGIPFRDSDIGKAFIESTARDATGMFQYCPHALVFGVWDSTGSTGIGNKFQRIITSEIIGMNAHYGVKTKSRIDPVIRGGARTELYETADGGWTIDPEQAVKEKGKPKKYGKKVSELNLGNVTPKIEELGGGVTISHAIHSAVISIPAIRKLHFPVDGKENPEANNKGRSVIMALALSALSHSIEQGYDLRSRCLLVPQGEPQYEFIDSKGNASAFSISAEKADSILNNAIDEARNAGLPWLDHDVILNANPRFMRLIAENLKKDSMNNSSDSQSESVENGE